MTAIPKRRRCGFNFEAKRRREIELHARHVEAAETEDFERWLLAWHWHNGRAADPLWSLMEAARRMGGELSEAEADEISSRDYRKRLSADALGMWLGITYLQRESLRITTIGSRNVKKRARKELRKRKDRLYQERKRRERGARPHSESLSQTKPWQAAGMGRTKWYEQQKSARADRFVGSPLSISHDFSVRNFSSLPASSSRKATLIHADRTNPSAVSRPLQAVPRPFGYDPVAAAMARRAGYQNGGSR
jgi:hypothetical protein